MANAMGDVMPNTAGSTAWVGEDFVRSMTGIRRERVWLLGGGGKGGFMVLLLKECSIALAA